MRVSSAWVSPAWVPETSGVPEAAPHPEGPQGSTTHEPMVWRTVYTVANRCSTSPLQNMVIAAWRSALPARCLFFTSMSPERLNDLSTAADRRKYLCVRQRKCNLMAQLCTPWWLSGLSNPRQSASLAEPHSVALGLPGTSVVLVSKIVHRSQYC